MFYYILIFFLISSPWAQGLGAFDEQDNVSCQVTPLRCSSPRTPKKPAEITLHGDRRIDDYAWLKDPNWPAAFKDEEILCCIHAEKAYTAVMLKPLEALEDTLYQEMKGRMDEEERSYPVQEGDYLYYTRFEKGKEFTIHCRQKVGVDKEEVLLDENELGAGGETFSLGFLKVNQDHNIMLYSYDDSGSSAFTIQVKDLNTNTLLADKLEGTAFNPLDLWHQKLHGFFYVGLNKSLQPHKVFFHTLGENQDQDKLIFQEEDASYFTAMRLSADGRFAFMETGDAEVKETLALDLGDESLTPRVIIPRTQKTLHNVDHGEGHFYISVNDKGRSFRLVRTRNNQVALDHWEELIPASETSPLTNFYLYKDYLVIQQKEQGIPSIRIKPFADLSQVEKVSFNDVAYEAKVVFTRFDDPHLRIQYSSLLTPDTVYEYDFQAKELHTRKVDRASKTFNADDYQMERLQAPSKDGVLVPITLVYRKDQRKPDGNPLLLYGYGASGAGTDPKFCSPLLSLLDRGFIYAIAHVRGGDELGLSWYEGGKLLKKWNTFEDFIACSEFLIEKQYTSKKNIALMGESAGGNLVGTCLNHRSDLYRAAGAFAPFVDVLNDMLDKDQPLTEAFYSEAGNPQEERFYHYIKSYSPYDNICPQEYPHLYVTTGLKDMNVPYWGPMKWVSKLRELKKGSNLILCDVRMEGGHVCPLSLRGIPLCREMSRFCAFLFHAFRR